MDDLQVNTVDWSTVKKKQEQKECEKKETETERQRLNAIVKKQLQRKSRNIKTRLITEEINEC